MRNEREAAFKLYDQIEKQSFPKPNEQDQKLGYILFGIAAFCIFAFAIIGANLIEYWLTK